MNFANSTNSSKFRKSKIYEEGQPVRRWTYYLYGVKHFHPLQKLKDSKTLLCKNVQILWRKFLKHFNMTVQEWTLAIFHLRKEKSPRQVCLLRCLVVIWYCSDRDFHYQYLCTFEDSIPHSMHWFTISVGRLETKLCSSPTQLYLQLYQNSKISFLGLES